MTENQLFASFVLDRDQDLEIAIKAESVAEATTIQGSIRTLPGGVDFLEGLMTLRNDVIPIINLKKRLGLAKNTYDSDAKVAVIALHNQRFGLLFDDIREVFRAEAGMIAPISRALQTEDRVVSSLIKREGGRRAVELLELRHLFSADLAEFDAHGDAVRQTTSTIAIAYVRYVVFACAGQHYGIPVECAQEITFCAAIDDMFRTGIIEGALELRGKTVPILNAQSLLAGESAPQQPASDPRILVLASDDCTIGIVVDQVIDIVTIGSDQILAFPGERNGTVTGIFPRPTGENVMLLDMHNLLCDQIDSIKSMARISDTTDSPAGQTKKTESAQRGSHHLITENCYLVFAIGKQFAIELKDVREIIEHTGLLRVPGAQGYSVGVINLRGEIVPVISLRRFFGYQERHQDGEARLIIATGHGQTIALEVDRIVTIYKQEHYHATPSLNAQLSSRKDTLDRLIEYLNPNGIKEHMLVVNTHNLIRNHLQIATEPLAAFEEEQILAS